MATGFPSTAQGVLFPYTQEPGGNRVAQAPRDRGITCRSGRLRSLSAVLMRELRPTANSATWMAGRQHCWDFQVPASNGRASSKSATKLTPDQSHASGSKCPGTKCVTLSHEREQLGFLGSQYRHKRLQNCLLEKRPPARSLRARRILLDTNHGELRWASHCPPFLDELLKMYVSTAEF